MNKKIFLILLGFSLVTLSNDTQKHDTHDQACQRAYTKIIYATVRSRDARGLEKLISCIKDPDERKDVLGKALFHLELGKPLYGMCCFRKYSSQFIIDFLLDNQAGVDTKNTDGDSLVHFAVRGRCSHLLEGIIEKGANVNMPNEDGKIPLELAREFRDDLQKNQPKISLNCLVPRYWRICLYESKTLSYSKCLKDIDEIIETLEALRPVKRKCNAVKAFRRRKKVDIG